MRDHLFYYDGKLNSARRPTHTWRTWFVDKSYRARAPLPMATPAFRNDGWIRELAIQFDTGNDDLRGGNDNVNLIVHLKSGSPLHFRNINLGARWLSNYTEHAHVKLARPIHKDSIRSFEFQTTFRGGISGDNWDARQIVVCSNLGSSRQKLAERSAFFRFTGSQRTVTVPMPAAAVGGATTRGKVSELLVALRTGGDDLRGGNDNLNISVVFRGGRTQLFSTVNARRKWENHSDHEVKLVLDRPVNRADIVGINLMTTSRGGFNGDNWNLDSLKVVPVQDGTRHADYATRSGKPLKRFTGSSRMLPVRW
jgi:hypothetical protein